MDHWDQVNAFSASQNVTGPVKGRDRLLSGCCSDCNSPLGSVERGHPECAFLLRPLHFCQIRFNVLWAPVSGLEKALSTGRRCHSLRQSCGFWIFPSVNTSITSARTLTVQRGYFRGTQEGDELKVLRLLTSLLCQLRWCLSARCPLIREICSAWTRCIPNLAKIFQHEISFLQSSVLELHYFWVWLRTASSSYRLINKNVP